MNTITHDDRPDREHAAMLVLRAMASAQAEGRRETLDGLASEIGLRRAELRAMLTTLHKQGLVDVMRMRLTFVGFAMGRSAAGLAVAPLRAPRKIPAAPASRAA